MYCDDSSIKSVEPKSVVVRWPHAILRLFSLCADHIFTPLEPESIRIILQKGPSIENIFSPFIILSWPDLHCPATVVNLVF